MKTVVVSHPMFKPGMDELAGKVNIIIPNNGKSEEILDDLKKADGFILRIGNIDRKAIEACPNLKVITRPGVGVDNVDVAAATEHGIPVVICPAMNFHAVAEHTLTLMFALSKNLIESVEETKKGNFSIRSKYAAIELAGKTVTVVGFGKIGREVTRMCHALGMEICVYDPFVTADAAAELGYTSCSELSDALKAGDFITLHMPSTPETRNMISDAQLAICKPTAFLINCARGDIIDERALIRALETQQIAGAGLDVLTTEPMDQTNKLFDFSNVIITPHMAAQTRETTAKSVIMAAQGTLAVLRGERWENVCNPEVYNHPRWQNNA